MCWKNISRKIYLQTAGRLSLFMIFVICPIINYSFIPAMLRVKKTGSSRDLSIAQYIMIWIAVTCWALYGTYIIHDIALAISNTVGSILALITLWYILKKRREEKSKEKIYVGK